MKLNEIRDNEGAHKRFRRIGRGSGSGKGKTAGRGVKGQKARTGHHGMFGFEGGQMPLHMRVPKRGFNNIFARAFAIVNTGQLQKAVEGGKLKAGDTLNADKLATLGICRKAKDPIESGSRARHGRGCCTGQEGRRQREGPGREGKACHPQGSRTWQARTAPHHGSQEEGRSRRRKGRSLIWPLETAT